MTNYHLTPPTLLPSLAVQKAKEKRRRMLEKAAQVRRANYHRFLEKKRRLQARDDLATIAWLMSRLMIVDLDQQAREQIERIVRMTGKPEKTVLREVVTNGLKTYNAAPSKSAQAVLDLIEWAEKEHITGKATDVSTNHNTYAWEE